MDTSTVTSIALASADDPRLASGLVVAIILFVIGTACGINYSRLFDGGRDDLFHIELPTALCWGLCVPALLCAFWPY